MRFKNILWLLVLSLYFAPEGRDYPTYIIDCIEENVVVVEWEGGHIYLPKEIFPEPIKEGDVLDIAIRVDNQLTESRLKKIEKLMEFDE